MRGEDGHWLSESELEEERRKDRKIEMLANKKAPTTGANRLRKMGIENVDLLVMKIETRGGHNRKTVEMINGDGYVTAVWPSYADASKALGVNPKSDTMTKKRGRIGDGRVLRYRDSGDKNTANNSNKQIKGKENERD